jgi:hypothetical protein
MVAASNTRRKPFMGTRAVYTFIDYKDRHSVYKHFDGYPSGACGLIAKALKQAWPLPRFEADEFAAAFVAANKQIAGGARLTTGPEAHCDLEYTYEISCLNGQLHIRINEVKYTGLGHRRATYLSLFSGTLDEAHKFAGEFCLK